MPFFETLHSIIETVRNGFVYIAYSFAGDLFAFLPIFAIPMLGYFGILFTYAHQASDFKELLSIRQVSALPTVQHLTRGSLVLSDEGERKGNEWDRTRQLKLRSYVFLDDDAVSAIVRGRIARHTVFECLVALAVMSFAFFGTGLFVGLPIDQASLIMSPYAFVPFPETGPALPYVDGAAFTGAMTALFWAYAGALVYAFHALAIRVNNRDATPGHFYALTARLLLANAIALAIHHAKPAALIPEAESLLPALYFFCGVFPQRIFDWLWARVAGIFRIEKSEPHAPSLLNIDGLNEHHIERLGEVGIDSIHALALADPGRAFVRLPYRLSQLIDWTSQAMLYWAFGADGAQAIRKLGSGNILEAVRFANSGEVALKSMAERLEVDSGALVAKLQEIENAQSYIRLRGLSDALAAYERG